MRLNKFKVNKSSIEWMYVKKVEKKRAAKGKICVLSRSQCLFPVNMPQTKNMSTHTHTQLPTNNQQIEQQTVWKISLSQNDNKIQFHSIYYRRKCHKMIRWLQSFLSSSQRNTFRISLVNSMWIFRMQLNEKRPRKEGIMWDFLNLSIHKQIIFIMI